MWCSSNNWNTNEIPNHSTLIFFFSERVDLLCNHSNGDLFTSRESSPGVSLVFTAISRKVVGKSARDNPERYCGWLWGHCSSKKFERMVREATDICLRVLKESNKSRFDSFSRYEQCIDHIPYYLSGLSRAHFFRQPFSKQLYKIMWMLRAPWLVVAHDLLECRYMDNVTGNLFPYMAGGYENVCEIISD